MTRQSSLVLDGETIKLRLMAERQATGVPVHVDWLRFTAPRRAAPVPSVDLLFPTHDNIWHEDNRGQRLQALIESMPDCDTKGARGLVLAPDERGAALEAFDLCQRVCEILGPEFVPAVELRKGQDFYRYRWAILRHESEVGWVGFLANTNSPSKNAQDRTLHVNLFGAACTFGAFGWRDKMADLIDTMSADITRCDLALDFFDGMPGGLDGVRDAYAAGDCDLRGKRPACNMVGDWVAGRGRSFYIGSKQSGKQTNVYQKGDQLFGPEVLNPWERVELRYGNKLRVLPSDMLRRPADFFAGASDWHALTLAKAVDHVERAEIKRNERLKAQSVDAEVSRNLRWTVKTASPSLVVALLHGGEQFLDLLRTTAVPGRLKRFAQAEIQAAMVRLLPTFNHHTGGAGHAFGCA